MIKRVVFFNTWHSGDLHSNKEYVRQFVQEFNNKGIEVCYATAAVPRAINLPIDCRSIWDFPEVGPKPGAATFFDYNNQIMYINTWVGYYMTMPDHNFCSQKEMWKDIALKVLIASDGEINIPISDDILFYVSQIDRDLLSPVTIPDGKKVLFCNDIAISKQSHTGKMESTINSLAYDFPEIKFICTNKINSEFENVLFTDDLTNRWEIGCDLPEIGFISEHCDVIITNSSGPGTFSMTKNNFLDKNKKIIAFVIGEGNTFWNGVEGIQADCTWHAIFDDLQIYNIVRDKINA